MGKLIVIDGLDGSGKHTNCVMLREYLEKKGIKTRLISFPDYESDSSALVKMYLGGEFGRDPMLVNPYVASSFYAVDRAASYLKDWKKDYESGTYIIADRYTTSNIIHQASKLSGKEQSDFILWTYEYEYEKLCLPRPDKVFYLDMPVDVSAKLISGRYSENGGKKDIHELDTGYLEVCRESALKAAELLCWDIIPMTENGKLCSFEENFEKIRIKAEKEL